MRKSTFDTGFPLKPRPRMYRPRAEAIMQSSSESSVCSEASSSTSHKQVTWGKMTTFEDPTFSTTHKKARATLDSLKRKLRKLESEKGLVALFKPRISTSQRTPQGILKPPTLRFPGHQPDAEVNWFESVENSAVYAIDSLVLPPISTPSDAEDTPPSSALSSPPESIPASDQWDTCSGSEYWSDQWDVTPELPSGWTPPLHYHEPREMRTGPTTNATVNNATAITLKLPQAEPCQPDEAIQSPGQFLEDMVSSLQYALVICGLGFMAFLFLAFWTMLLVTCGVMIASAFPAVLIAYGFTRLLSRTKYSVEWLLMSTIKIGGGITLGIGIALVIVIEYLGEGVQALCAGLLDILPTVIFLGISAMVLVALSGSSIHGTSANSLKGLHFL